MSILVHDGSVGCVYNSYASLADADAYHAARATASWTAADPAARTAALIRATDYIDATYTFTVTPYLGTALDALLVKATIAMAANALGKDLAGEVTRDVLEREEELTGVVKERTKYDTTKIADPYPLITKILAPITGSTGGGISVGRLAK